MTALNLANLAGIHSTTTLPRFDPATLPLGVVHFGPGAFHRAHQAAFFDAINAFDPRWGICGVSLHTAGVRDALTAQNGLYTLAILDQPISYQVIGSLRELLVAHEDAETVFARLSDPAIKIVTSTVTEKGYCLKGDGTLDLAHPDIAFDLLHPHSPRSFIGYLAEGLRRRFAAGLKPFVLIPCDNLPNNGVCLKAALVAFVDQLSDELSAQIQEQVQCPCTMVDSITPATDDALRKRVSAVTGLADQWPIQREGFLQWVIEAYDVPDQPDWKRVGVDVTDDVSVFERAKLRLLNGPHSTLSYMGSLRGYQTVYEAMQDAELAAFVETFMKTDIVPLLQANAGKTGAQQGLNLHAYCDAILQRLRNPAIKHLLAQIACDGSQKLPIRILAPLAEALLKGSDITRFGVPLAAWLRFIRLTFLNQQTLSDPLAQLLVELGGSFDDSLADVDRALALTAVFSPEIAAAPEVVMAIKNAYQAYL